MSYRRPLTLQQIFTEVVDILGRPNKHFYKNLAKFATDPKEKAELKKLVGDDEESKKAYKALTDETVTYVDILNKLGTQYQAYDVLSNGKLRSGIKEFSNWPTLPQLYIDGEFVGGCDICVEMFESGELAKKLDN